MLDNWTVIVPEWGYNTRMRKQPIFPSLAVSILFILLAGLAALTSCQRKSASERELVAKVDGQPIFRDQVERVYRSRQGAAPEASSPEEALSFKLNVLDELINNQILVEHASHAGITVSEAEVDKGGRTSDSLFGGGVPKAPPGPGHGNGGSSERVTPEYYYYKANQ